MDESLKNLLFAADVIKYVMKGQGELDLGTEYEHYVGKSPFRSVFGDAVISASRKHGTSKQNLSMIRDVDVVNNPLHGIVQWTLNVACEVFKTGYCPKDFVDYCGFILCIIQSYVFKKKNFDICKAMIGPISCILDAYTLTREFKDKGGWDNLMKTAEAVTGKVETSV